MAEFKVRTRGNADPYGKPRVYFTCHSDDFEKYFDKVCEDIFVTHAPAIYYTEDMNEQLDITNITVDLGRMNLFVVPVSFKLMNEPNRAMLVDIAYAKKNNIPILPLMMESGIDAIYSLQKNFGDKQYLNPFSTDSTEISYADKLKKSLETILISDEMANRIKAAFDTYIFLSYRKKDRRYANELMKIIHNIPGCQDIAIWYDEFLTPGESFLKNIDEAMAKSKLFALLVTPSLLEYVECDGKFVPNFVMGEEYPAAKNAGIDIVAAEMIKTDHDELKLKFEDIPTPILVDDEMFAKTMLSTFEEIVAFKNNNDPEHNFLIGLAYINGVDVEKNIKRGVDLIVASAELGYPEAMQKLFNMYCDGDSVSLNYLEAIKWGERLFALYTKEYGDNHPNTLTALHNLAYVHGQLANHKKALELKEKVYTLSCENLGAEHPDTLISLNNLSQTYSDLGDSKKALILAETAYSLSLEVLGENHQITLTILNNLALIYNRLGCFSKALEVNEKVYVFTYMALGDNHPDTLTALHNLSHAHCNLGDCEKALEYGKAAYSLSCRILGDEHLETLSSLSNLAFIYNKLGDYEKAFDIWKMVHALQYEILGEEHPDTLCTLANLAHTYGKIEKYEEAIRLEEKVYTLLCNILGEEHPDTLLILHNLACNYRKIINYEKALELGNQAYSLLCKNLGEDHPTTVTALENVAYIHLYLKNNKKALELFERLYVSLCKYSGENHKKTIEIKQIAELLHQILG